MTKLRCLIVRALSRRMQVERDMTVQQRLLTALYHACLPSEAARTQLASVPLSFANAKRLPDMETRYASDSGVCKLNTHLRGEQKKKTSIHPTCRYLARMVDFMSKSVSAPPPEIYLPGPVVPQKWHDLPSSDERAKKAKTVPF